MQKDRIIIAAILILICLLGQRRAAAQKSVLPEAPTALRLIIVPDGFKLSWKLSPDDPGIVTGYEIVRSDSAGGPFTTIARVDKGVSGYVDTTASREIIYYYMVRALAEAGQSPYSNPVTGER